MKVLRALTSGGALMLLAVILGVGTAAAAFVWLDGQADDDTGTASAAATSGPTREVVVLLEDVPAGSPLPQAALALRPKDANAHYGRGNARAHLKRYAAAIADWIWLYRLAR